MTAAVPLWAYPLWIFLAFVGSVAGANYSERRRRRRR